MKGLLVTTGREISTVEITEPVYLSIRPIINGYLEVVHPKRLQQPYCMVVDEEGLLKGKDVNIVGCYLYETDKHGQPIVGDILILREEYGNDGVDLTGLIVNDIDQLTTEFTLFIDSYAEVERREAKPC